MTKVSVNNLRSESNVRVQEIRDIFRELGWREVACAHLLHGTDMGSSDKISALSFVWNMENPPVYPDGIDYVVDEPI